jgi:hypothetical protein
LNGVEALLRRLLQPILHIARLLVEPFHHQDRTVDSLVIRLPALHETPRWFLGFHDLIDIGF